MDYTLLLFIILAVTAVATAAGLLLSRSAIYAALFLVLNFATVAVFYLVLGAPFVAMAQVTVYAGAIMVLFLFVVMLINLDLSVKQAQFSRQWPLALFTAAVLLAGVIYALYKGGDAFALARVPLGAVPQGNTQRVGMALYQDYMLAVEIASLLLLVAMVGAVLMAKRKFE